MQNRRPDVLVVALGALAVSGFSSMPGRASPPDEAKLMAYGAHLARECTTCHRLDGANEKGIPAIIGWPKDIFIENLKLFKQELRTNQAMISVAKGLDDEQMLALATYFAAQTPAVPNPKQAPAKKNEKKK